MAHTREEPCPRCSQLVEHSATPSGDHYGPYIEIADVVRGCVEGCTMSDEAMLEYLEEIAAERLTERSV